MSTDKNAVEVKRTSSDLLLGTAPQSITRDDREQKGNKARWSDLDSLFDVYRDGIAGLIEQAQSTMNAIQMSGIKIAGNDTNALFKVISDDITRFTSESLQLREIHIKFSGYVKTPQDHAVYLKTYEQYRSAIAFFQGCTQQHAVSLTEIMLVIQEELKKRYAQEQTESQQ